MGDYGRLDGAALDRYITGNYGEDQFRDEEYDDMPCPDCQQSVDYANETADENTRLAAELAASRQEVERLRDERDAVVASYKSRAKAAVLAGMVADLRAELNQLKEAADG